MIKFDRVAANQSLSTPSNSALTLPNAPRTLAFILRINGLTTGDNPQYLISTGNYGAAGSLNVYYNTADGTVAALRSKIIVFANTASNATSPLIVSTSSFTSGEYLIVLDYDGTTARLYSCPILASTPVNGDAVILEGSSTDANIARELIGAGFKIGSRMDDAANRKCDQSMARVFLIDRVLTGYEKARLAFGEEITGLGYAPKLYVRMSSTSDIQDRSQNALPFTLAGSPTTSAEPAFGYNPSAPPVVTDMIDVTPPADWSVFQQAGGYDTVPFTGALAGTAPTSIEYQLRLDGAIVKPWAVLPGLQVSGSQWLASVPVAFGGFYQIEVRSKNGSTVLASSGVKAARFAVGNRFLFAGSSSAEKSFQTFSGTGFAPAANTAKFDGTWKPFDSNGCATDMARRLAEITGGPVGFLDYGVGGDVLSDWIKPTYSSWTATVAGLNAVGKRLAGVFLYIGSNDAAYGTVTSREAHAANLRTLINNIRTVTGQPDLPFLLSGFNSRTKYNTGTAASFNVQANRVRMAENDVGGDMGVTHVQTIDFQLSIDGIHLSDQPAGFLASGVRSIAALARRLYGDGVYMRGPKVKQWIVDGTTATGVLEHRGSSDINVPNAATGLSAQDSAGNALTVVSVARTQPDRVAIKFSGVPAAVQYLSGSAPTATASIYGNTSPTLPMVAETDLLVTQAAAAPEMPARGGINESTLMRLTTINVSAMLGPAAINLTANLP